MDGNRRYNIVWGLEELLNTESMEFGQTPGRVWTGTHTVRRSSSAAVLGPAQGHAKPGQNNGLARPEVLASQSKP